MSPSPTRRRVELRWQDIDAYGHVHTVAHVSILEHARAQFFNHAFGSPIEWDFAVVHLEIDFLSEMLPTVERQVICEVTPVEIGTKSIRTREEIFSLDGRRASSALCVSTPWDRAAHQTRGLSGSERAALQRFAPAAR